MSDAMLKPVRRRPANVFALIALTAAAALTGGNAYACNGSSLRFALMGKNSDDGRGVDSSAPVARYEAGDGDRFIFDRSGTVGLLRFEHSEEVWALRPTPGPGGDVIWRNDLDQPVLRLTRLCGLTLFTTHAPQGEPVAFTGEAPPPRQPRVSPATLIQTLNLATVRVGRATGRSNFQIRAEGQPGSEFVFADTIAVTADTLIKMASFREGRPYARGVREIHIHAGKKVEVKYRGGVLDLTIRPQDGVAGRPSSSRIARTIVSAG
jgi:hypothetical protein